MVIFAFNAHFGIMVKVGNILIFNFLRHNLLPTRVFDARQQYT